MQEDQVPRCHVRVIHIEYGKESLDSLIQLLPLQPRFHHGVDHDIKELCQKWAALGHTVARLKRPVLVPRCAAHIWGLVPEVADQPAHVWPNSVRFQDDKALLPIHGIKRLLQVDEDPVEGGLLNVSKLLGELCFDDSSAGSSPIMATVEAVV